MKFFNLLFFLCLSQFSFSQNSIYDKVIETDIGKELTNALGPMIKYYKGHGNTIIRIDGKSIALYDQNFNEIWKKPIEALKATGNQNYFICEAKEDFIYLGQYGVAFENDNVNVRLLQYHYDSGESKFIELNEIVGIRTITNISQIEDRIIINGLGTSGIFTPYGNVFIAFQPIITLNENLEQIGEVDTLPYFVQGTDFNIAWAKTTEEGNSLQFQTAYFKDKKGKTTKEWNNASNEVFLYAELTEDGEFTILDSIEFEGTFRLVNSSMMNIPKKYSQANYNITVEGKKYEALRFFDNHILSDVRISNGMVTSKNIVDQSNEILGMNGLTRSKPGFSVKNFIEDPINKSIVIIATANIPKSAGKKFGVAKNIIITLDESLNIAHIQQFETSYPTAYWALDHFSQVIFKSYKAEKTWGAMPTNHKLNAIDYMYSEELSNGMVTFINFEDSQIGIFDDFKAKNTRVFMFR